MPFSWTKSLGIYPKSDPTFPLKIHQCKLFLRSKHVFHFYLRFFLDHQSLNVELLSPPPFSLHRILSLSASLSLWGLLLPPQSLSTRLSDVSDEVAKNFLSGGAGDQAGLQTLPPLTLGLRFRNPWELGSPHTPRPAAFKVPAAPAAPPSLGPGMGTTATISSPPESLPHAHQLFEPRCPLLGVWFYCLSVASSGTAAAPAPGLGRGTEDRAEGPLH